jgi:hypothetical protein
MTLTFPQDARKCQYLQHIVGGLQQCITPISAGTAALWATGNTNFWVAAIPFALNFILGRLSSEISYQTSIRLFKEYKK